MVVDWAFNQIEPHLMVKLESIVELYKKSKPSLTVPFSILLSKDPIVLWNSESMIHDNFYVMKSLILFS